MFTHRSFSFTIRCKYKIVYSFHSEDMTKLDFVSQFSIFMKNCILLPKTTFKLDQWY